MIQFKAILLLLAVALTLPGEAANASHPFHVTRAEVEYNADRQTFEVAICVWPEDLALAVSKMEKRTVKIDSETEASRDEIFSRYVAKKFRFVAQTKTDNTKKTDAKSDDAKQEKPAAAKIRWVGSELEIKQGWLYFEVDAKTAATDWTIENRMFFELNDDQLNQIQIRNGKALDSQTLSANQTSATWSRETK